MTSLYQITTELQDFFARIEANEGVLTDADCAELDAITAVLDKKQENIGSFILNLESTLNQVTQYRDNAEKRMKRINNKINWLKDYLLSGMISSGISKIETPLFDIRIRNNPEHVVINNDELLSDIYFRQKIVRKINKSLIKEALKSGGEVAGAHLESSQSLVIKSN